MASAQPPIPLRTWMVLAAALSLGLAGTWMWQSAPRSSGIVRVLIIAPEPSGQADVDLGLETLLQDHFEVLAGATVTHAKAVPPPAELRKLPSDLALFRFQGRRDGHRLALTTQWTTPAKLLAGRPWSRETQPPMDPGQALEAWVDHWPLDRRHRIRTDLHPSDPGRFWDLLQAMSIRDDQAALAGLAATQALAEAEPRCATAWATLGDHLYRCLWVDPAQAGVGLNSRTHRAFQRAVELVPGHPRATFLWSLMLTDTGNQDRALRALEQATHLRPGIPDLYHGFAYAGRTAGLLEGAKGALARQQTLLGPMAQPSSWFAETTYLYLGDWDTFGRELLRARAVRLDANVVFYQGYYALLRGDRQAALAFMKTGEAMPGGPAPFQDLCRVYLAYLEGRREDGLAELRRIDDIRGKLRIPDGEWTFKEAEAYSLLGDADRAVDCATRAFVQGFSCARWYEASPFLDRMRTHPRWPTLRRNIQERQAVLEGSFPPSAFGP